jgi:hypothetical protein
LQQNYAEGIEVVPGTGLEVHHQDPRTHPAYYVGELADNNEVKRTQTLCGLRRRNFWLLFSFSLLVIALVVALPVTLTNKTSNNQPVNQSTTSASPATPSTSASTTTSNTPASSVSAARLPSATITGKDDEKILRTCPWANGTEYTASNGGAKFQRLCSYIFTFETIEGYGMAFNETSSLEECLDRCAAWNTVRQEGEYGRCVTVAWRYDPNIDYWSHCWGGAESIDPKIKTQGLNTTEHTEHAPVDSAWMLSGA